MIIPDDNHALVLVHFDGAAVPNGALCTFGVRGLLGLTVDNDLAAVAAAAVNSMHPDLAAAGCHCSTVDVKVGPNDVGPTYTFTVDEDGASGSSPISPNVAMLIRKVTAIGGRRGRGRMFWPGVDEAGVGTGGIQPAGDVTAKQGVIDAFFENLTSGGLQPVVFHDVGTVSPTDCIRMDLDPRVATQRKRLRR